MLIAGLGNPGAQYAGSPHNCGFMVLDGLVQRAGVTFRTSNRFRSWLVEGTLGGEAVTFMKPATFMNASGEAIGAWLRYYKVPLDELLVVYDDADLPLGRLRIRTAGGSGGHNGLRSIVAQTGDEAFPRLRMGIGRDMTRGDMITHVLRPFEEGDRETVGTMVARAVDAVVMIVTEGVAKAMNRYNVAVENEKEQEKEH